MEFIDLKKQYSAIKASVDARIARVLEHVQFVLGPEVGELEQRLAAYTGAKHCVTAASGTDALLIALMALGVGAGDEVITSPFTFIASAEVIALLGARPVFVDIDARTYNLDPKLLEPAITPRTRAIMPVSLYGQCADFDAINAIAARHGISVVEDAAQSFGATYKGRRSCNLSTIGCTSFFPSKPLGCYGEGGACFTNDDQLAERMRQIRVHGQDRRYHHPVLGINGRLDSLQAAVLLAKMEVFDAEVEARRRIASRYTEKLHGVVGTPYVETHNTSVFAQYTVQISDRDEVSDRLKQQGIPTAVHYPVPLHLQPVFSGLGSRAGCFPVSEAAARLVLSLPMHPYLSEEDQDRVCAALREVQTAATRVRLHTGN
ncbi:MAG: DegT/DnrJ/EryC1/StrS family aminotransferase [Terriglobales bacterium]